MNSSLPWIILFAPLVSVAVIMLAARSSRALSSYISVAACAVSFAAALPLIFGHGDVNVVPIEWIRAGDFRITFGVTIDELSRTMLFVVTGIGLLIHIYSLGYMKDDAGRSRYFAGLSLFMFSMLGIVLADNFVMMFVFWELVGVSSYLLIGHWFQRPAAADAAKKAFLVNRIGDFGFMLGILMLWVAVGSVAFKDIEANLSVLALHPCYLATATLLVFCGAVGKSAQFPLHVWLPDAMEGPTPVSALIHAATMVAAGVYMLVRVFFLVEASVTAAEVISWIGIVTAVLAALMATQQNDIKRILAYSTLSQLGYMVMAVGMMAGTAAMFHLFTHAFFKALLFLGAGSVIHGLHHEQNIWKMGGLKNKLPITFITFFIGTMALTGFPYLFSGFYSKDAILVAAFHGNKMIFGLAVFVAFLTSFYMFRLFVVAFLGKPRSDSARDGQESPGVMTLPLVVLSVFSVIAGFPFFIGRFLHVPHENIPVVVPALAAGVFALGLLLAWVIYRGKTSDPILVPLFARRFYIDEAYTLIIRSTQGALGVMSAWIDRWILDGLCVRGVASLAWGAGYMLRFLQVGNLQAYAFLFGLGVVGVVYFILFN